MIKFKILILCLFAFSCLEDPQTISDVGSETQKTDMGADTTQTTCEPDCEDGKVCKTNGFVCVACVEDAHCTDQVCNTDSNECVDCLDNSLCTEVAASTCGDGTCGACVMNEDCAHLEGTPRCDGGTCAVECEDDTHCGGKVCDVTTNTCTTLDPGTATQCQSCVSDTQCSDGFHCMPLGFGSPDPIPHGNYCLKILGAGSCNKPYRSDINRKSLNGAPAESHCGISEELTTCEAVLSAIADTECKDDNADAADLAKCPVVGARCEKLLGNWTCTYSCDDASQCTSAKTCGNKVDNIGYCG